MFDGARIRARSWGGRQLRRGRRTVLLAPHSTRVGNLLYFWLHAHLRQAAGREVRVLGNQHVQDWATLWPLIPEQLAVDGVRRTDRLLEVPPTHFQDFGRDFSRAQLDAFIRARIMTAEFESLRPRPDPHLLVVNVRRGDYYSNDEYRARYAMDIEQYVERAVGLLAAPARIRRVGLVSDDPGWCLEHLGFLRKLGSLDVVTGTPPEHLAYLSSACHLVLANSTFSYWGAYIAAARGHASTVVAPTFHAAHVNGGVAWQLDPHWQTVDLDLPR